MRNSNVMAIAPTATISNITATSPCIEPTYKNLFVKSNLSGEFIVLNPFLVKDLKARGLWNQEMADNLKYFDGELKDIETVPASFSAIAAYDRPRACHPRTRASRRGVTLLGPCGPRRLASRAADPAPRYRLRSWLT